MTIEEKFGISIRQRRIELGISQVELGDRASLHRTYIGSIERGERNISLLNIISLCDALKIKPSELMVQLDDFVRTK